MVWRRKGNASNVIIDGASHLVSYANPLTQQFDEIVMETDCTTCANIGLTGETA